MRKHTPLHVVLALDDAGGVLPRGNNCFPQLVVGQRLVAIGLEDAGDQTRRCSTTLDPGQPLRRRKRRMKTREEDKQHKNEKNE